ncbi:MAG: CobW family GTP-binding protein [Candidatus Borkfalkiaceae bacterium]|nr:GTP-binding protein [Clostridia bacterium]MDY6224135.1 CobW family GTP-binding protein [Christensenellaceae bacterium]
MTKIDVYSGFLGAGKTTLIKKLIKEAYAGEKVVLIENEFGEIGVDGGFLKDAGVNITEMNSGCICCSLVGDFAKALKQVEETYSPDRIVIEPSGVGKLSDVIRAVQRADVKNAALNAFCAVVDAGKCKMYMKNFGEFFTDQVANASCIVLSHTAGVPEEKLQTCLQLLKEVNPKANYVTADWDKLDGKTILAALEQTDCLEEELKKLAEEYEHDHDDHDEDDDEHEHEHEHEHGHGHGHCCHHHDHEEEDDEHDEDEHEHGHEHGHHHHHADEVFTSWGVETAHKFTEEELKAALAALADEEKYGTVLRAKGIVAGEEHCWHFDYVPGEADVRSGGAIVTGRLCVIGCRLNEEALKQLFKA